MSEGNKIAAAILACEASRQHQEMVRAGPGKAPGARDVAGELWSYFEDFHPLSPSAGSQVRIGLAAGGKRIRTAGPTSARGPRLADILGGSGRFAGDSPLEEAGFELRSSS
jgi:hypothetical protein